jgi:hypothetical protein
VCDTPRVVRTTDRGVSWTTFDLSAHADRLIDCRFPGDDVGFVVGGRNDAISGQSRGVILFTDDGGATWSDVHVTSVENAWCWKISFPSATTGYVSVQVNGPGPVFLKTTDGGASWTEKPFPQGTYFEQGIGFATETTGWIGGDANTWETTDGGDTWSPVDIGSPANDDNVNRFRFLSPTLGYAVGRKVYKYFDDAVVAAPAVGAEPHEPVLLVASRPNPFRTHSEIEFDVPVAGPVRLSVYDVLGRERLVLVDGWREEGRQVARLEGGTLPGSVYVLRLETAGGADHRKVQRIR